MRAASARRQDGRSKDGPQLARMCHFAATLAFAIRQSVAFGDGKVNVFFEELLRATEPLRAVLQPHGAVRRHSNDYSRPIERLRE